MFYWYTPFQVLLNFVFLIVGSFALGIASACLTTFLFRKCRFLLNDKGVSETTVLFLLGFTTYLLAECMNLSGIISILCYGVILNRYNYFNLSPGGKVTSKYILNNLEIHFYLFPASVRASCFWSWESWFGKFNGNNSRLTILFLIPMCSVWLLSAS